MAAVTTGRAVVRGALAPLAVSLVLLAAIEATLHLIGFSAEISAGGDPKANQTRLFEPETRADGQRMMVRKNLPVAFRAQKSVDGFRIFVIGESSVWGFPYGPELAFSRFLQDRLQQAWPRRDVEVINCGVPAIASWHTRRIVDEIVSYQPNLVIIYTGHNDWIVPPPEEVSGLVRAAAQTRLFQLAVVAGDAWRHWRFGALDTSQLKARAEPYGFARDRARGRLTMTTPERAAIVTRYQNNLRAMVRAARAAGASVMIAGLAQNFSEFPPGASRHRHGVTPAYRERWRTAVTAAQQLADSGDCRSALRRLDEARRIDARPALLHFARGRCLGQLGRFANARTAYRLASDLDEIPLGAPTWFNDVMHGVASETGAIFVDVAAALQRKSPHGLVGDTLFVDHVHPSVAGHLAIARVLADALGAPPSGDDAEATVASAANDPSVDRRVVFARIPLYLVLGWYDQAAQAAREARQRYPDVHLEDVVDQLRSKDPQRELTDLIEAPDRVCFPEAESAARAAPRCM